MNARSPNDADLHVQPGGRSSATPRGEDTVREAKAIPKKRIRGISSLQDGGRPERSARRAFPAARGRQPEGHHLSHALRPPAPTAFGEHGGRQTNRRGLAAGRSLGGRALRHHAGSSAPLLRANFGAGISVEELDRVLENHITRHWPRREETPLWQSEYWDRQLRRGDSYAEKWEYVVNNPVRHGLVKNAAAWPYQGELNILEWHD